MSTKKERKEEKIASKIWVLYLAELFITVSSSLIVFFLVKKITEDQTTELIATLITGIIVAIACSIFMPIFARYLSDRALFWIRVPERFAIMVIKDRNLEKIYMAVSDKKKLEYLRQVAEETQNKVLFKFISGGQLIWIGCPWSGYSIETWYEKSFDQRNSSADPHCTLDLMERIWDYGTEESYTDDGTEDSKAQWGVETRDNIQVTPKIVVVTEVVNPQKAIYGVTYFREAINKEVLIAWKKAVQDCDYFVYAKDKEVDAKNGLQAVVQDKMNILLGLSDTNNERIHLNFFDENGKLAPIGQRNKYPDNSPARLIFDDYGFWLKRVEIRDIDPTDDDIRNSIQEIFKARNAAKANIETAAGEKQATIEKAIGKVYETTEIGKAKASAIKAELTAKASGMKKISKELSLSGNSNELLLTSEMTIKMLENADYTYLAGQPSDIGAWAMAAVDRMKSGIDKIKTGSETKKEIGFEEIKEAWASLDEEQKTSLLGENQPEQ